ncbi:hypothetical protein HanHA89_Chr08g0310171 [Helianthus annuus]|nr:hypothetical protein HanHA89_Chr08g0310171 [Helianthus annuus]
METVRNFSKEQVDDVKSMGFGSILDMNLNHILTRLGFWLVRNFDEEFNELNVGNHQIKITSDSVHEVFGIPKGPKQVVMLIKEKLKKVEKVRNPKVGILLWISSSVNGQPTRGLLMAWLHQQLITKKREEACLKSTS